MEPEVAEREAALISAARKYRDAVANAEAAWIANGRRGASDRAVAAVNRARLAAKTAHERLIDAINALDANKES